MASTTGRKTPASDKPKRGRRSSRAARSRQDGNAPPDKPARRQRLGAILLRLTAAEDAFLAEVVGSSRERAQYFRRLLQREIERHRRLARVAMFAAAAETVDEEERTQRRALVKAFSNRA